MTNDPQDPKRCPWCGGDCRYWGLETCPYRPQQIPREQKKEPLWKKKEPPP